MPDAVYTSSLFLHNCLEGIVIISILQIKKQVQRGKRACLKSHSHKSL